MIITAALVKQYLGITAATYDAQIALFIPDIDALVKDWCDSRFYDQFTAQTTNLSADITVGTLNNTYFVSEKGTSYLQGLSQMAYRKATRLSDYFKQGDYVTGSGIPTDAYITDIDDLNLKITISAPATATASPTLYKGFNRMYNSIVANLVWYKITNATTKAANSASGFVTSISQGPTSKTFDLDRSKLFRGVPIGMLEGLPRYIKMQ